MFKKNDIEILTKTLGEDGILSNHEEIKELFQALKKISKQAEDMKLVNAKEIITMCRKKFGEKIGKAFFLW